MTDQPIIVYLHKHEATGVVVPSASHCLGHGWVNLGRCFE